LTCTDVIFGTHNAMIDSLGDVKKVIRQADPTSCKDCMRR